MHVAAAGLEVSQFLRVALIGCVGCRLAFQALGNIGAFRSLEEVACTALDIQEELAGIPDTLAGTFDIRGTLVGALGRGRVVVEVEVGMGAGAGVGGRLGLAELL